jgi:hypothetical protein
MAKQHQKRMLGAEQTIAEPDAPENPALMPDSEQVITTETTLPNGGVWL